MSEGKKFISFSGGKDSTAMLLKMIEKDMKIDKVIFADTTFEFPEMYDWIKKIQELIPYEITIVKPQTTFNEWFYGKFTRGKYKGKPRGFPFVVSACYWSRESKIKPLEKAQGKNNTIYIGFAYDEKKRADAKRYKRGDNVFKFPLIEWKMTEQDCIDYLKEKGLDHPLKKFKRTGCWLCPKQSIGSLKILYNDYPQLWKRLKKYEEDSSHGFRAKGNLNELEKSLIRS